MRKKEKKENPFSSKAMLPAVILLTALLTACGAKTPGGGETPETAISDGSAAETTAQTVSQTEEAAIQEDGGSPENNCVSFNSGRSRYGWWRGSDKYTEEDYEQVRSYQAAGYENMSVDEFNRMVMDWEDEDAFHKTEEVFQRIFYSLKETDPMADFVYGTLSNTWDECERKHYGICQRQKNPWHSGEAFLETYGDVFGDKEFLTGSYADYSFDYTIPDEQTVTVAQRDGILKSVDEDMQAFLKKQSQEALQDEDAMEKAADAELVRLLKNLGDQVVWEGGRELSYYWNDVYDEEDTEDWYEERKKKKRIGPSSMIWS